MSKLSRRNLLWAITSSVAICVAVSFATRASAAPTLRPHEKIDAALHALDDAREELNNAGHDFGGHKADALRKVEAARDALVSSRDRGGKKEEAVTRIEEATTELRRCEEFKGPREREESAEKRHPKIHKAIEALEDAKEEL